MIFINNHFLTVKSHRNTIRRLWVFIAVIAIGLRSLIPVGYMPDFSGQGKGIFPITLCDGFEHTAHSGHMHHSPDGKHSHGGLCPFGMSIAAVFGGYEEYNVALPVYRDTYSPLLISQTYSAFPLTNISPRAPPYFS